MRVLLALVLVGLVTAGCGLDVQGPDLFLLTRTGQGTKLTMLVNYSGTIACDGRGAKPLPDPLLLQARNLATTLNDDAQARLRIPAARNSVYFYRVELEDGTISFPDTAGGAHPELAQLEAFVLQAAPSCR